MDPVTIGLAGAGMVLDFIKSQQARKAAQASQQYQMENLSRALSDLSRGRSDAMRAAGGLRLDQFGNATYYDPNQGRWITSFSPEQQRIIDEGQARQRRAQIRGAQASEDFDRLRGEYLYRKPETEAQSYADIVRLLGQARGTEEQQLNTLYGRIASRTGGNVPEVIQNIHTTTPGQALAQQMLQARGTALDESIKRRQAHTAEYLPALKQFEETANYVAPEDPTGKGIIGLQQSGLQDILKTGSDYDKLLATMYATGGRNVASVSGDVSKAAGSGPGFNEFAKLAGLLKGGKTGSTKAGATALDDGTGSTYSATPDYSTGFGKSGFLGGANYDPYGDASSYGLDPSSAWAF